jgi:hypothetical protein
LPPQSGFDAALPRLKEFFAGQRLIGLEFVWAAFSGNFEFAAATCHWFKIIGRLEDHWAGRGLRESSPRALIGRVCLKETHK